MMVSFVLSFFPRDVLDEILNLIESVSEDFPSYSYMCLKLLCFLIFLYLQAFTISCSAKLSMKMLITSGESDLDSVYHFIFSLRRMSHFSYSTSVDLI